MVFLVVSSHLFSHRPRGQKNLEISSNSGELRIVCAVSYDYLSCSLSGHHWSNLHCFCLGVVIDTERDIVVDSVPIITPNGDIVVSRLTFKVSYSHLVAPLFESPSFSMCTLCASGHVRCKQCFRNPDWSIALLITLKWKFSRCDASLY